MQMYLFAFQLNAAKPDRLFVVSFHLQPAGFLKSVSMIINVVAFPCWVAYQGSRKLSRDDPLSFVIDATLRNILDCLAPPCVEQIRTLAGTPPVEVNVSRRPGLRPPEVFKNDVLRHR